jgi:hypothetical protein
VRRRLKTNVIEFISLWGTEEQEGAPDVEAEDDGDDELSGGGRKSAASGR